MQQKKTKTHRPPLPKPLSQSQRSPLNSPRRSPKAILPMQLKNSPTASPRLAMPPISPRRVLSPDPLNTKQCLKRVMSPDSRIRKVDLEIGMKILDQMGFKTRTMDHHIGQSTFSNKNTLSQYTRMTIAEFWSSTQINQFLRKTGLWQAQKERERIIRQKLLNNPITEQREQVSKENPQRRSLSTEDTENSGNSAKSFKCLDSNQRLKKIDKIIESSNKLQKSNSVQRLIINSAVKKLKQSSS